MYVCICLSSISISPIIYLSGALIKNRFLLCVQITAPSFISKLGVVHFIVTFSGLDHASFPMYGQKTWSAAKRFSPYHCNLIQSSLTFIYLYRFVLPIEPQPD